VVPLIDLSRRFARDAEEFHAAMDDVLRSGTVLLGSRTTDFESQFARFVSARHAVAVSSGASALHLVLAGLNVGIGDEVIVPAMTAVPTASAVCAVGATPVFADVDPSTATISPDEVARVMSPRTAAIIGVHLYGRPMNDARELADFGVPFIEDCAQSHGATRGLTGVAGAYSFYPTKNLGGIGDGGMIVTDDADLAEKVRRLRVHGQVEQYLHLDVSQNHRLSEIEAAWLSIQLRRLDEGNDRRRSIAHHYREELPDLRWQSDDADHVHHLAVFCTSQREEVRDRMRELGVATGVHYPFALTQQPAMRPFVTSPCPVAERWAAECISVPCFPELTDVEVDMVVRSVKAVT
jgi:dTDP-4-amino-4,6-dideoxygalactose transaminase